MYTEILMFNALTGNICENVKKHINKDIATKI